MEIYRKSLKENKYYLACSDWRRTHHEGDIEKLASRYQKEGLASFNLETRREILTEEHGDVKTKALDKYIGGGTITRAGYTEIVNTLWGGAPTIQKTKAVLLCQAYHLNPLMKHLYLIGFKRWKKVDGKKVAVLDANGIQIVDWSILLGIGATRLLAQRKHNFSYLDMTPRAASDAEVKKITGKSANPNYVYGFTHLKDVDTGAEAFGLRHVDLKDKIQGQDKGNTHENLACIRSERQAIDRQYPGEMPEGLETVDERYMDVGEKIVDTNTGEIVEGEATEVVDNSVAICPVHNAPMIDGKYGAWCPNKIKSEKGKEVWCKGKAVDWEDLESENQKPTTELVPEPEPDEPLPTRMYDPSLVKDDLKRLHWQDATVKSWLTTKYNVDTSGNILVVLDRLNREQLSGFISEIQDRLNKENRML